MNDDVKAALALARRWSAPEVRPFDGMDRVLTLLADHIDGEPARLAAAVASRDAEWKRATGTVSMDPLAGEITALRARVAELEAEHVTMDEVLMGSLIVAEDELDKAKAELEKRPTRQLLDAVVAERDALRAQTSLTDGPCVECGKATQWAAGDPGRWPAMLPTEAEPGVAKHHHVKCVLGWRAQVEAARAVCSLPCTEDCNSDECTKECADVHDVLRAMDESKP